MLFQKGHKHSEEIRKKISNALKGHKHLDETKIKISIANIGRGKDRKLSEETKRKIGLKSIGRKTFLGKKHTDESKNKISEANKGKKHTEETKQKMRKPHRKFSEETKNKMKLARKNISEETRRKIGDAHRGLKHSDEAKRKMSKSHKGIRHPLSLETIKKITNYQRNRTIEHRRKLSESLKGHIGANKGKHFSIEIRQKMSNAQKGNKNYNWKGGITPILIKIRESSKYREWRQRNYIRDNFVCQECKDSSGNNLEVHHKKSFSKLVNEARNYMPLLSLYDACMLYEPLWDINNGITLCKKCHGKTKNGRPTKY